MEKKYYRQGHVEELIVNTYAGNRNIVVDRIELVDSPTSFTECGGEFKILDTGLYRVKVKFDALGEFLYRVKLENETVSLFKVVVVPETDMGEIKKSLESIKNLINDEDAEDDIKIQDIYKLVKRIYMKT